MVSGLAQSNDHADKPNNCQTNAHHGGRNRENVNGNIFLEGLSRLWLLARAHDYSDNAFCDVGSSLGARLRHAASITSRMVGSSIKASRTCVSPRRPHAPFAGVKASGFMRMNFSWSPAEINTTPYSFVRMAQRRENFSTDSEVGMSHVGALFCMWQTKSDAAELLRGHVLTI
jgi:hypothetical protein